jgi:hypothetical protein
MRCHRGWVVGVVWATQMMSACTTMPRERTAPACEGLRSAGVSNGTEFDRLELVLVAAEQARQEERRCGRPDRVDVICRALWLGRELDPVVVAVVAPGLAARSAVVIGWGWESARSDADDALNDALAARARLDAELTRLLADVGGLSDRAGATGVEVGATEVGASEAVASVVAARAAPVVLEPLARAEGRC